MPSSKGAHIRSPGSTGRHTPSALMAPPPYFGPESVHPVVLKRGFWEEEVFERTPAPPPDKCICK